MSKQFSITTNDGHGHGDIIGAFTVTAETSDEAVQKAYRLLATRGDYDTIVVSADPASTPERAGLPCPTCGGKRWLRAPVPHDEVLPGRSCPDCSDGVWTPPDSPVPIGVTSEYLRNSARYGPWIVRQPVTGLRMDSVTEPWTMFDPRVNGSGINIAQSSVIGEATLRPLKVVEADADGHGAVVEMRPDGSLWFWPEGAFGEDAATDISSALPFLPGLKPGDTVYLLDGFTQSVECDGGRCGLSHRGCYPGDTSWCSSCDQMIPTERNGRFVTHWHRPMRRSCPFPVDAPDHPCVIVA